MINTADIEAGDKVHLRDGSVLTVAIDEDGDWWAAGWLGKSNWCKNGMRIHSSSPHVDIIRIEKAPKPVVKTYWLATGEHLKPAVYELPYVSGAYDNIYAITITDGEATIERVK